MGGFDQRMQTHGCQIVLEANTITLSHCETGGRSLQTMTLWTGTYLEAEPAEEAAAVQRERRVLRLQRERRILRS